MAVGAPKPPKLGCCLADWLKLKLGLAVGAPKPPLVPPLGCWLATWRATMLPSHLPALWSTPTNEVYLVAIWYLRPRAVICCLASSSVPARTPKPPKRELGVGRAVDSSRSCTAFLAYSWWREFPWIQPSLSTATSRVRAPSGVAAVMVTLAPRGGLEGSSL